MLLHECLMATLQNWSRYAAGRFQNCTTFTHLQIKRMNYYILIDQLINNSIWCLWSLEWILARKFILNELLHSHFYFEFGFISIFRTHFFWPIFSDENGKRNLTNHSKISMLNNKSRNQTEWSTLFNFHFRFSAPEINFVLIREKVHFPNFKFRFSLQFKVKKFN